MFLIRTDMNSQFHNKTSHVAHIFQDISHNSKNILNSPRNTIPGMLIGAKRTAVILIYLIQALFYKRSFSTI